MDISLRFLDTSLALDHRSNPSVYDVMCLNYTLPERWKEYIRGGRYKVFVDGGFEQVASKCSEESIPLIYPDLAVGDFDSVSKNMLSAAVSRGTKVVSTMNQDLHDFDKAITEYETYVSDKGSPRAASLLVLGALGGRRDQEYANIMAATKRIASTGHKSMQHIHLLGHEHSSVLCLPKGRSSITLPETMVPPNGTAQIGVFPLCGTSHVTTKGLKWDMSAMKLSMDSAVSSSNSPDASTIVFSTSNPIAVTITSKVL